MKKFFIAVFALSIFLGFPQSEALIIHPGQQGFQLPWPEKPTLDCRFTENDCGMTYTGASTRTMFDSTRTMVFAPHNLTIRSENIDVGWSNVRSTDAANSTTAPDGSNTADTIIEDGTASSNHYVSLILVGVPSDNAIIAYSTYVKAINRTWVRLHLVDKANSAKTADFNVAAGAGAVGTVSSGFTGAISDEGDGWFRVSMSGSIGTGATTPKLLIVIGEGDNDISFNGLSQDSLYLWGVMVNRGSTANSYGAAERTTTAAFYGPRVGAHTFDTATSAWVNQGFLPEETRTNLVLQSETLTTSPWQAVGTFAAEASGTIRGVTRFLITRTGTTNFHRWFQNVTFVEGTQYTVSALMEKATQGDEGQLYIGQSVTNNTLRVKYDLVLGTATTANGSHATGTLDDSGMIDLGDGTWLVYIVFTFTDLLASANGDIGIQTDSGDTDGDTVYASAVQWEVGGFPLSYSPTTTAQVVRAADVDSQTVTSLLGTSNTLFVSARTGFDAGVVVQIDDGTENERYRIERNSSNEIHVIVTDGGVAQADLNLGAVADNTAFKVAVRLGANDFSASLDGAAVVTDTSGTLPTVTTARYGMDTANDEWNSTIARVTLWNRDLADGRLIDKTAFLDWWRGTMFAANDNAPFIMIEVAA